MILFTVLLLLLAQGPSLSFSTPSSSSSTSSSTITSLDRPINVIVIGGSSGMGKAAALAVVKRGGNALIVSRSKEKLQAAAKEIQSQCKERNNGGGTVQTAVLNICDEDAVSNFAQTHLCKSSSASASASEKDPTTSPTHDPIQWDGVVFSAAGKAPHGPITTLPTQDTRDLFETKFWGAYLSAKYFSPYLRDGGALVFVSGVLNRRPGLNCSPLASTNGALEGLTRALALELGPKLRVNCLSPGFCNTERFDHMDEAKKEGMLRNTAESLPLKRVGEPEDMGEAIYYLLTARFCTGVVLDCDGGHHIRQYANAASDPMRQNNKQ